MTDLLELAGEGPEPAKLTEEEDATFDASFAEAERGAFATEDEVRAVWAKHAL